jgi:serine/threonine protein kinase
MSDVQTQLIRYQPLQKDDWKEGWDMPPMREYLENCRKGERIPWDGPEGADRQRQFFQKWESKGDMAPFDVIQHLGGDVTEAIVERVSCTRCPKKVAIARKLVNISERPKAKQGIDEIRALLRVRHPHVVALIDPYIDTYQIGILLYPAAQWNLKFFMRAPEQTVGEDPKRIRYYSKRFYLRQWFVCLSQALEYLHTAKIRHKDITPTNVLVDSYGNVLLSDFGLSRRYRNKKESVTNTETATTPEYTTPEFAARPKLPRGPPADIFGLGLVFAEMATVIMDRSLYDFQKERSASDESENSAYCENPKAVRLWLESLISCGEDGQDAVRDDAIPQILKMISRSPKDRPAAKDLYLSFESISPFRCPDCHPKSQNPWKVDEEAPVTETQQENFKFWGEDDDDEPPLPKMPDRNPTPIPTDVQGNGVPNGQQPPDRQTSGSSKTSETQPFIFVDRWNKIILYDVKTDELNYVNSNAIEGNLIPFVSQLMLINNRQEERPPKEYPSLGR